MNYKYERQVPVEAVIKSCRLCQAIRGEGLFRETMEKEAGGEVTDINGLPLDFSAGRVLANNSGIVATNGRFHSKVLAALRQTLDSE